MRFAVGNTVFCKTEREAKTLCFEKRMASKCVTEDGTVIKSSGVMSGGKADVANKAHRWEEKKVEALRREKEDIVKRVSSTVFNGSVFFLFSLSFAPLLSFSFLSKD